MADTQRTLAAVLSLLADNTAQAISAQDLRDAIVSVFANYGMIYVHDGTTAQTGITSAVVATGFANDGLNGAYAGAVTVDKDTAKLTASVAGVYLVWFTLAVESTAATEIHVHGRKNGADHVNELACDATVPATNKFVSMASVALVTLAASDYIQLMLEAGSSSDLTLETAQFGMIKVG